MTKKTNTAKTTETKVIDMHEDLPTKSAKIRAMTADGLTRSEIAKALDIRYQHVRNVQLTPLKKDLAQKD